MYFCAIRDGEPLKIIIYTAALFSLTTFFTNELEAGKCSTITSDNIEQCYNTALKKLKSSKFKTTGIREMARFLYVRDLNYKSGAIMEMGESRAPIAIKYLKKKGLHTIAYNNLEEAELITTALLNLKGYDAIFDLTRYSKSRGTREMTETIRNEFMVYTSGPLYRKMEKLAGRVFD